MLALVLSNHSATEPVRRETGAPATRGHEPLRGFQQDAALVGAGDLHRNHDAGTRRRPPSRVRHAAGAPPYPPRGRGRSAERCPSSARPAERADPAGAGCHAPPPDHDIPGPATPGSARPTPLSRYVARTRAANASRAHSDRPRARSAPRRPGWWRGSPPPARRGTPCPGRGRTPADRWPRARGCGRRVRHAGCAGSARASSRRRPTCSRSSQSPPRGPARRSCSPAGGPRLWLVSRRRASARGRHPGSPRARPAR